MPYIYHKNHPQPSHNEAIKAILKVLYPQTEDMSEKEYKEFQNYLFETTSLICVEVKSLDIPRNKTFRVMEGNDIIVETDDKTEAVQAMKTAHHIHPSKFHELYQWETDGRYHPLSQYAPGDDETKW